MFGWIYFFIKLVLAGFLGSLFTFEKDIEKKRLVILLAILFAAVGDIANDVEMAGVMLSGGLIAGALIAFFLAQNGSMNTAILVFFAAVIGLMIGSGFLIKSVILAIIGYFVMQYLENIFEKPQGKTKNAD